MVAYEKLKNELESLEISFSAKRSVIVLTKSDLCWEDFEWDEFMDPFEELGVEVLRISSVAQKVLRT